MSKGSIIRGRTAQMFTKRKASIDEAMRLEREDAARRLTCPVEIAKTALRRRGFQVYAERILGEQHVKSDRYVVGTMRLTEAELLAYAAKRKD